MRLIDTKNIRQTIDAMMAYSKELGYELTTDDCIDIIDSGYHLEPLRTAVHDWLNTWETCRNFEEDEIDA